MKAKFETTGQAKGNRTKYVLKGAFDYRIGSLIAADQVRHYRDAMSSIFPNCEESKQPEVKRIVITITLP